VDPFEATAQQIERATDRRRLAERAAPGLLEAVKETFADGQIRGLVKTATARAEGSSVVLTFDDRLPPSALHADPLPPSWQKPLEDAARAELGP
jgi:hypothetical protein